MAFNQKNFAPVHTRTSEVPGLWSYKSAVDDSDAILAPDYFAAKKNQLEIDDFILVSASDFPLQIAYKGEGQPSIVIAPLGTPGGPTAAIDVTFDPSTSDLDSTNVQDALVELANETQVQVLMAQSLNSQLPVAVDIPIQLEFGPAQGTVSDPVMIDANGQVTINQAGYYTFIASFQVGRTGGSGGVAEIHIRGLINGVQTSQTASTRLDNPNFIIPLQFEINGNTPGNALVTVQLVRDSMGANEGGVLSEPVALGWNQSPSAQMEIFKL